MLANHNLFIHSLVGRYSCCFKYFVIMLTKRLRQEENSSYWKYQGTNIHIHQFTYTSNGIVYIYISY